MVTRDSLISDAFLQYINNKNESWRRMPKGLSLKFAQKDARVCKKGASYVTYNGQMSQSPKDINTNTLSTIKARWQDEFLYQALKDKPYGTIILLNDGDCLTWEDHSNTTCVGHTLIVVEENAKCELLEHMDLSHSLRVVDIHIKAGGFLKHYQKLSPKGEVFDHLSVLLESSAKYEQVYCLVSDKLYRRAQQVRLMGSHSQATTRGGYVAKSKCHVQEHITFYHSAPNTQSHHWVSSVVEKEGKADVYSSVDILSTAPHSLSRQHISHLLLDEDTEAFAKPALNIEVDEVDSQHGALTGMIDDSLLFYMESRGIDKETAREIYLKGYIQTCFEMYPAVAKQFTQFIETKLLVCDE